MPMANTSVFSLDLGGPELIIFLAPTAQLITQVVLKIVH
jgi:hypothetical protein